MFTQLSDPHIAALLVHGSVGVIPTDTIYGIVCRAHDAQAFKRLYSVRGRNPGKPSILLVTDVWQIPEFSTWHDQEKALARAYWPGPLTIVVPRSEKTPAYLADPATDKVSYRVPLHKELRALLAQTGPLIAPSANLEGQPPAADVKQAQAYFGDAIDFYVDGGPLQEAQPSTVVTYRDGDIRVLRQGSLRLKAKA